MPTLDWLNRDAAFRIAEAVPTRVLRPHAAGHEFGQPGEAGNLLIQGDNLEALRALLPFYRSRVKCIFIDPPYNTKSAFEHYDDNLEHSQWLSMMLPRLQLLRELLSEDGSIWVTLDDAEAHYFRVLGDEVFGRDRFILDIAWRKRDGPPNDRKLGSVHDHLLIWARHKDSAAKKSIAEEAFNLTERTEKAMRSTRSSRNRRVLMRVDRFARLSPPPTAKEADSWKASSMRSATHTPARMYFRGRARVGATVVKK